MGKVAQTVMKAAVLKKTVAMISVAAGAVTVAGKAFVRDYQRKQRKKKGEITMKKSTFVSILVFLAAVAGALGAAYLYLVKREQELAEYEQMLFSEDYEDTDDFCCGDCDCGCADDATEETAAEPAAPAEEPAE